jgi:hypothetical protein
MGLVTPASYFQSNIIAPFLPRQSPATRGLSTPLSDFTLRKFTAVDILLQ